MCYGSLHFLTLLRETLNNCSQRQFFTIGSNTGLSLQEEKFLPTTQSYIIIIGANGFLETA